MLQSGGYFLPALLAPLLATLVSRLFDRSYNERNRERARRVILLPDDKSERLERVEKSHIPSIEPSNSVPPVDNASLQTPVENLSYLDSEMFEVKHSNKSMNMSEKSKNYVQLLR